MDLPYFAPVIQRLVAIHKWSLPSYLIYAEPYLHVDDADTMAIIRRIAYEHQFMVERLKKLLDEAEIPEAGGGFPMRFAHLHDLSVSYVVRQVIDYQRLAVDDIAMCVDSLVDDPELRTLAEPALRQAEEHLEMLRRLVPNPQAA